MIIDAELFNQLNACNFTIYYHNVVCLGSFVWWERRKHQEKTIQAWNVEWARGKINLNYSSHRTKRKVEFYFSHLFPWCSVFCYPFFSTLTWIPCSSCGRKKVIQFTFASSSYSRWGISIFFSFLSNKNFSYFSYIFSCIFNIFSTRSTILELIFHFLWNSSWCKMHWVHTECNCEEVLITISDCFHS